MSDQDRKVAEFAKEILLQAEALLSGGRGRAEATRTSLESIARLARMISVLARPEKLEAEVKETMRSIMAEDPPETSTGLVEDTAEELEMEEILDDPHHPIWDWGIDVFEEQEPEEEEPE